MIQKNAIEHNKALVIMAKRPAAGNTKTRLSPPLSPASAARLYECFLLDTIELVRRVPGVQPAIAYLPSTEGAYFQHLAPGFELIDQQGTDLGARLDHVTTSYLARDFRQVVVMDSDSPTLPLGYLERAFAILEGTSDLILGPCDDGGYYLIGMKAPMPRLLHEVRMSTSQVTAHTLALAEAEGLHTSLLPAWYDVDDLQTLVRLQGELKQGQAGVAPHTRRFLDGVHLQK